MNTRVEAKPPYFGRDRRAMRMLVRPFGAAGNPQHPPARRERIQCANQIEMSLPRLQPACRKDHDII